MSTINENQNIQIYEQLNKEARELSKLKNYEQAIEKYEESSRLGSVKALLLLANNYLSGQNIEQNIEKGLSYLLRGAELNHQDAFYELGSIYEKGIYQKDIDLQKAKEYYEKAGNLGHQSARYRIAFIEKKWFRLYADYKTGPELVILHEENSQQKEQKINSNSNQQQGKDDQFKRDAENKFQDDELLPKQKIDQEIQNDNIQGGCNVENVCVIF